jgi:hypothetical protein
MTDVDDRLADSPEPNPGETVEGYRRRVAALGAGAAAGQYEARRQESKDRRYVADTSYKGTKYSSDNSYKGTVYSSDRGLEGTKYGADRSLEGTKYRADVDERGNKMNAGNTFLKTYADLSSTPSNYFQAQEFLHNGVGAGYGNFVDDAMRTVRPAQGFRAYTGNFPGNAAQAMFAQGGDDYDYDQGRAEKARRRLYFDGVNEEFSPYGRDDIASSALADWRRESGRRGPNLDDPTDKANFRRYVEDWNGVRRANAGTQMASDEATRRARPPVAAPFLPAPEVRYVTSDPYDQGGENTWGSTSNWNTSTGGGNDASVPASSGTTNWNAVNSWGSGADKKRLEGMDAAFRPGVHKWGAGYWEGLADPDKDLWRSYWSYRGLDPKSVEAEVLASRTGNADAYGSGRLA